MREKKIFQVRLIGLIKIDKNNHLISGYLHHRYVNIGRVISLGRVSKYEQSR